MTNLADLSWFSHDDPATPAASAVVAPYEPSPQGAAAPATPASAAPAPATPALSTSAAASRYPGGPTGQGAVAGHGALGGRGGWGAVPDPVPIDWTVVNTLRIRASDRLTRAAAQREGELSAEAQRELGRTIILELIEEERREALAAGVSPAGREDQLRLARAVHDTLFGLGRLQPLVDDDRIENIEVNGCDRVTIQFADGRRVPGPPVADSDAELIAFLSFISSRVEGEARSFSPTRPSLHMTLQGGARLAATAWITPRPIMVIRRHRLLRVTLSELVGRAMMTPLLASFLAAAIKQGRSVVVSGPQGAGKTTLVRALAEELQPWERIGTFETEYELFLHQLQGRYATVAAWQARPGTGERGPDGRQAGEITLDDCLYDSFRFNLDRQIVGEVRGREVLAMFKAMQSGAGSISTTHAASAAGAIRKLVTCALEAGPHITVQYAERVVAEHIDLIVQIGVDVRAGHNGEPERHRYVREVIAVHPGEDGPAHTTVFRELPGPHGPQAMPGVLPDEYRALARDGFDLTAFVAALDSGSPLRGARPGGMAQ